MNRDDKHEQRPPDPAAEAEARIVAWVAGEASAFEVAELERLVRERPELAVFKRRITAVQGLVAGAARPDKTPLHLAPERRAKLLQALGGTGESAARMEPDLPVYLSPAAARRKQQVQFRWMVGLAACAAFGGILFTEISQFGSAEHGNREAGLPSRKELAEAKAQETQTFNLELPSSVDGKESEEQLRSMTVQGAVGGESKSWGGVYHSPSLAASMLPGSKASAVPALKMAPRAVARAGGAGSPVSEAARTYVYGPGRAKTEAKKMGAVGWAANEVKMSPFEVKTTEPAGYLSTNTLAGTRVRTDLKDVSSNISVATQQFLQDTGAKNSRDLLTYATAADVGGVQGNFTDAASDSPAKTNARDWASKTGDFGQAAALQEADSSAQVNYYQAPKPPASPAANNPSPPVDAEAVGLSILDVPNSTEKKQDDDKAPTVDQLTQGSQLASGGAGDTLAKQEYRKTKGEGAARAGRGEPTQAPARVELPVASATEVNAAKDPVSTFSLHVSDASFKLAQLALAGDQRMDPASIQPEEFYNAFDYGDPAPAPAEKVACRIEQAAHPFLQQRNLVRIAMKVAATGRDAGQPLRLTVLLDTSGSMEREDRAGAVRRAMEVLVSLLGPSDRLTLIGFARQPRLLADQVHGDQARPLLDLIAHLPAEGGTNFEEALKLGGELALRQFDAQAQNRLVLLTDGAANLGNAEPGQLADAVGALRQQGIAFDACGVGTEGLDDTMLEALTRKGDGRYYVLNSPESADAGFARQLAGAFRPAAENVKVQVRFNPSRVGNYRLIGFEHHRLRAEDFRNDQVTAAQLAAEEAAVAVYQVEALPQGEGELGDVFVRFRDPANGAMVERSWTMVYEPQAAAFDRATPTMQLAGTAALLAEKLRGGAEADPIRLAELAPVMNALRSHFPHQARVQELITMFGQTRKLAGE